MQVLFVSFSDMWHLLQFSVFIWQVIKFKTCYAEDGRDMNTGMKASSGWMDFSTELIPLSHPNADQWESPVLFARLHFEPHSHIQQAHRGLTSQWLHTDCCWKCDWMKLLSCHVTKNRYVELYTRFVHIYFQLKKNSTKQTGGFFSQLYFMPVMS